MGLPISIAPAIGRRRLTVDGVTLVDTSHALILSEQGRGPVIYVPRGDVAMQYLVAHDRRTHCPWKGEAAHFSAELPARRVEIAAWSYEDPLPEVAGIAGHLAFYLNNLAAEFQDV